MNKYNNLLSRYATANDKAIRLVHEDDNDIRPAFFRDIDRILYSLSYTRYIDKTQVYSNQNNDHISKRITHVQMVSKIARTIGRALNLNEDLIEAIALSHDLGHVPFGHVGEAILNDISIKYSKRYFNHNVQSVRILMDLEHNGIGSNISLQVLDGALCHNGEFVDDEYYPKDKTIEDFLQEYELTYIDDDIKKHLRPMTLEGCVVRISDIIGYLGRDIEDAIRLGKLAKDQIPKDIINTLGSDNSEIINTIIMDIVQNSLDKPYIKISSNIYKAIVDLKKFNYEYIYNNANSKERLQYYKTIFNTLFDYYYQALETNDKDNTIFTLFLNDMSDNYKNSTTNIQKCIDFIAGMTDDFIQEQYKNYLTVMEVKSGKTK